MREPTETPRETQLHHGAVFWVGAAIGGGIMAYGAWGILRHAAVTHPAELAWWIVGAALVHDLLVAPAVFLAGRVARRAIPAAARGPVQAALIMNGTLALFALPMILGLGGVRGNPTVLPQDYGTGLLVATAVVWSATLVFVLRAWRRARAVHTGGSPEASR